MKQRMAAYLWPALHSLTIAEDFKSIGFADLQIVTSKITKFLLVNTGYDSIKKLEEKKIISSVPTKSE